MKLLDAVAIVAGWSIFGTLYGHMALGAPFSGLVTGVLAGLFHTSIVSTMDFFRYHSRKTNRREAE